MKRTLLAACAIVALTTAPALAQQKTVKIGLISTFSGPPAAIGNDMRNSFELALDHLGRKLGGLPVEVIYEDDQTKPDAGEQSSPYVFSTSWNNDQTPQAIGLYMNQKNVKSVFLIGPNYAAGKDMLEGVAATFKGQIIGRELTAWPGQLDFSAELSKARAAKPDAIFAFYPGGAGIQFVTQYAQSGLKAQIPLYTAFTIDSLSLPRLKDLAVGIPGAQHWVRDLPNEANKKYVADFRAKHKSDPSFYGSQTYDAVPMLDSVVKAVKGDLTKKDEMRRAAEKADFKSVRGNFKFGPNHMPIQNFYLQDTVKDGEEYRLKTVATITENDQDKHFGKCKMPS